MSTGEEPVFPADGLVRAARRRADLSQRELARSANVSPSMISRVEAGTITPSLPMLSRLIAPAMETGHLTIRTNATVREVTVNPDTGLARGARFIDTVTGRDYEAKGKVVIVAASTPVTAVNAPGFNLVPTAQPRPCRRRRRCGASPPASRTARWGTGAGR